MRQLLEQIVKDQVSFNAQIYPDWYERDLDWKTAVWARCPDLLAGESWEWWKSTPQDLWKAQLAAVDVFCFLVSWLYVRYQGDVESVMEELESGIFRPAIRTKKTVHVVQAFAAHTLVNEMPSLPLFGSVLLSLDLTVYALYSRHYGVLTLNQFRQDNDYRVGGYQRVWNGKDDTEYLELAVTGLPEQETVNVSSIIYRRLDNFYRDLVLSKERAA
jgi:hypothetical protein